MAHLWDTVRAAVVAFLLHLWLQVLHHSQRTVVELLVDVRLRLQQQQQAGGVLLRQLQANRPQQTDDDEEDEGDDDDDSTTPMIMESESQAATQPITRICVSVEQMAPLLEKLYAAQDKADAENSENTLRNPPHQNGENSTGSWSEAVAARLKESQETCCAKGVGNNHTDGVDDCEVRPKSDSRQNHTDPNLRPDYTEAEYGAPEYVNYIDLSEGNPIIEAHMCFQSDELFEGRRI